jgi:hypothetical protein
LSNVPRLFFTIWKQVNLILLRPEEKGDNAASHATVSFNLGDLANLIPYELVRLAVRPIPSVSRPDESCWLSWAAVPNFSSTLGQFIDIAVALIPQFRTTAAHE